MSAQNASNRSIFRAKAIQHYTRAREEVVLPRLLKPRVFLFLWGILGLLGVVGVLAWMTHVPVFVSGSGVVVEGRRGPQGRTTEAYLAVLLPEDRLSRLAVGQRVFVRVETAGGRWLSAIAAVEADVQSPVTLQRRFGLSSVERPSAVVFAPFEPSEAGDRPSAAQYLGSVFEVDVEVGSRSLLSLLPIPGV